MSGLGGVEATAINAADNMKIAILGLPKSGKSKFAVTMPGNKLVYDFDARAISIAGTPNTIVKTLVDASQDNPTAMNAVEADLSSFKYKKLKGIPIPEVFIFDTVTFMKVAMENQIFKQDSSLGRAIRVGQQTVMKVGKSFDAIRGVQLYLNYIVTEFSRLGHVIVVFHERYQKDPTESTKEQTAYTGKVTVDPQFLETSLTIFNDVYRMEVKGGVGASPAKFQVTTKASNEVNAATTLLVDSVEEPNLEKMLQKHKQAIQNKTQKS